MWTQNPCQDCDHTGSIAAQEMCNWDSGFPSLSLACGVTLGKSTQTTLFKVPLQYCWMLQNIHIGYVVID